MPLGMGNRAGLRGARRLTLALTAGAILVFALACVLNYRTLRDQHFDHARAEAQRTLLAFEAHSARLFDYTDSYLRSVRAHYEGSRDTDGLADYIAKVRAPHAEIFSGIVSLVDGDGTIVFQSELAREALKAYGNVSGLDHFRFLSSRPGDPLFVGATRLGKVTGKYQFRLARALHRDGQFDGTIILTLLPEHISDFYRDLSLGPNSIAAMTTRDGRLIARQPAPADEAYERPAPDAYTDGDGDGGSILGQSSPLDGTTRDVFFRHLRDYPVTLMVGIAHQDLDAQLAGTRTTLTLLAAAFTAFALVVCALALRLIGRNIRLAEAEAAGAQARALLERHQARLEEEVRARTADLEVALSRADAASRAKSDFLATMSHEFRTPLNAILGFCGVMREGIWGPIAEPKYTEYLGDIDTAGRHLLALVNDLLDVSALEAGAVVLQEREVRLDAIVAGCCQLVANRAEAAGLALRQEVAAMPPLLADDRRLRQVLLNLLSNAVKFTRRGGTVSVRAWREPDGAVTLAVADTGIGMDDQGIALALTRFGQVDDAWARQHEGSGLGLPLARSLVELHGGTLVVESKPGEGTVVTIRLPGERVLG